MALKGCLVDGADSLYSNFNPDCLWHGDRHLLSVFKLLPFTVKFFFSWLELLLCYWFYTLPVVCPVLNAWLHVCPVCVIATPPVCEMLGLNRALFVVDQRFHLLFPVEDDDPDCK